MDNDYSDKRRKKRRHLIYYLQVFDQKTKQLIGHLVDITHEGIMIVSEQPIEVNKTFQIQMVLPAEIQEKEVIYFEAISVWCKKDINPDFWASGFRVVLADDEDMRLIEKLINRYGFNN